MGKEGESYIEKDKDEMRVYILCVGLDGRWLRNSVYWYVHMTIFSHDID